MKGNRLVIGLDYGTTYTGVSFCEASDANSDGQHIEIIHDWPSRHTKIGTKEKVPSEVAYLDEGICWGSNIPPHEKREMWTKLQLELDHRHTGEAAKISQELSKSGPRKEPVEIVADFLAQVKAHLITNLDNKFGKELWRTLSITLVITVPAVWSDGAKNRTLQAVDKAGFNKLSFPQLNTPLLVTTEPEAAAIYTMRTLRGTAQNEQLTIGDGFIVCDMGGGTVDLIAYRVKSLQPTIIEEATVGNGAQCGGIFVDRAFLRWLECRLGTSDFVKIAGCRSEQIPRISLSKKAAKILQDFTLEVKTGFSGTETGYLVLPNPLSAIEEDKARGIRDGEITVTAEDTTSMFETSICRTYELLNEQLQRARKNKVDIKYVFLVGGFSESPYMHRKIKEYMEQSNIATIKPSYAWSAVARGAAAKGLEGKDGAILARKSRRHYGTSMSAPFSRRKHRASEAYYDEFDGRKMAMDQMEWLVAKGQDLKADQATHASATVSSSFWPGDSRRMHDVPESCLEHMISTNGKRFYDIEGVVNISMQASLEFFVTVNGKRYGSLIAQYD
ncbi:hypothetical protein SNOG_06313 [Parastagonospora nodorum SN15]|uniref:Uncharacterized protein n=1 Tax=Phaeosphaeria nodorum (strain SN15 / ATCC MYA-4574 / FGSC 10173) TaxID=321614 RepID=Q0UPK1_PHANO|nr:hypothetical protein SNOG_06313 [Parastagonospora nodorum SN15]EAT86144.2 hypothetical protein SNOG_06313 [Parastagonospora nodorum SN15]